ncbi:MAG TPA: hypothetical protein VFW05_04315 [Verrucomicrobiae bacterium]|nr:hypothetical protein [Verrucomicrobiae bacterium]
MSLPLPFRKLAICWCLLAASPFLYAESGLTPSSSESAIIGLFAGDQTSPQVALSREGLGGYLVWQDNSVTPRGGRIKAQQLDAGFNAAGAPFVVSSAWKSKATGDQDKPQIAVLPDGGAVIVWQGGKSGARRIYARFINSSGKLNRSDIRVSRHPRNDQIDPAVAVLSDGTVVIVWSSFDQDGSRQGVFAQRFSSAGKKIRREFKINDFVENNQRTPSIAALADGGFVVIWISESQRSLTSVDVMARLFDASGVPSGTEFFVNTTSSNLCANPSVAAAAQGGFAVTWGQNDNVVLTAGSVNGTFVDAPQTTRSTNSWDIYGRVFDNSGLPSSDAFRVNSYSYGDQYVPHVIASGENYFGIWTSLGEDGSWEGVFGQLFSSSGDLVGQPIPVNTTTLSRQMQPAAAADGAGSILTVWSSFNVGGTFDFDLFAQKFSGQ